MKATEYVERVDSEVQVYAKLGADQQNHDEIQETLGQGSC